MDESIGTLGDYVVIIETPSIGLSTKSYTWRVSIITTCRN